MICEKTEAFIVGSIMEQNWQLFLSFLCFNFAYFLSNFSLVCYLLCAAGLTLLISTFFNTLSITSNGRGVLVTGCDTGFGHELAKKLHSDGFTVFAGCLDGRSNGAIRLKRLGDESGRLHVIAIDVTSQEDVDKTLRYVEANLPEKGLWGLVNNAGQSSTPGFLEWTPMKIYETVMAVNVFGVIRVTNAFLPLIRKSQGRIVNVSSILARTLSPFAGSYTITKNVIDAYTTILRLEMNRFNVKVVVVEPGNFMTATNFSTCNGQGGFAFNARRLWDQLDEKIQNDYGKECLERQIFVAEKLVEMSEGEPSYVVNAMASGIRRLYPKDRYFVASLSEKFMAWGMQYLPLCISDLLVSGIESHAIPIAIVPYVKYIVLVPSIVILLLLAAILRTISA
ncbi:D-beta-hydroxybutyrate dehydrogenase, mitochondrial-like [Daphnia carinata]|uniref:D-beta-hydroxybutyrate dehydrogenase, mitochondrial-like n=1 Tax=Daphnia carinata TaxID=120202 RepID=UPI00257A0C8D|nr:D-beta-hydroxybutyrate dehydrogenase, mitochondrial-like [Daphnia carinata]